MSVLSHSESGDATFLDIVKLTVKRVAKAVFVVPKPTPFNIIAGLIVAMGLVLTYLRFAYGLAAVTNLDGNMPWGFWIGFDLLCGVALAAGGYTTSAAVYIFGMKKYHAAVRPAILTGFLGYSLVPIALLYDVGRPWRLPYPFVVSQGTTSVMFEVAACVGLYVTVLFLEWSIAPLEWLKLKKIRNFLHKATIALTIFGVVLSTLHQSSLGAMYLMTPGKLHPLWYSTYLPVYFFVSSIIAGLSMVMFEGALSHKYFAHKHDEEHRVVGEQVAYGFAKASSVILLGYFVIKLIGLAHDNEWAMLTRDFYGWWFLLELLGFVALPCLLFAIGAREKKLKLIQVTAGWTVFGIVLNRLNVSLVAFNYHLPSSERYVPHWMEIGISLFLVTCGVIAFKFIVTHMPIFYSHPEFPEDHH